MDRRALVLALTLVTALIGTAAPPALSQESPAPSPSPAAETTIGEGDDLALVVATAVPDELAADLSPGLGADLLDPTGSPDGEAVLAALGGWSALLLPQLIELAGDDPELLALLEAMGSTDALDADLLADIAAEVERVTGADEPQDAKSSGKKSRDREPRTEGAAAFGLLAATRGSAAQAPGAPAAEAPAQPAAPSGAKMADLAVLVNVFQEVIGQDIMRKLPAYENTEAKDGAKASFTMDLGSADRDFVIGLEGEKDGQKATGSTRLRLKGNPCPDADGTVKMEFKVQSDVAATVTAGSFAFGDGFEGTATGHVDDSATLTGFEYEGRATARKAVPGRSGWVESTSKASYGIVLREDGKTQSTLKEDGFINPSRWSSQAKQEDADRANQNGQEIHLFVLQVLANWQSLWRSGWCVKIKADIPATLKPAEQRTFDVHVVHKDGSELDAPVDATLSGKQSLDPLRIDHAPGQLTYSAGDQKGDTATVDLVSTSRRGIGKLSGTVKVDEQTSYQARSIPGVRTWTGACIDALDRGPIVLRWEGGDNSGTFTLDPASESEGSITMVQQGKGPGWTFKGQGKGRYRVEGLASDPDESPKEVLIVYSTKGTVRNCVGGHCTTSKVDSGEASIPLDVLSGNCPVTP